MFDLKEKVCLVTGSSKGIGKSLARALGSANGIVIINGRDGELVDCTVKELCKEGIEAYGYPFDVTDSESAANQVQRIEKEIGPIDVLINNAGINLRAPIEDIDKRIRSYKDKVKREFIKRNENPRIQRAKEVYKWKKYIEDAKVQM